MSSIATQFHTAFTRSFLEQPQPIMHREESVLHLLYFSMQSAPIPTELVHSAVPRRRSSATPSMDDDDRYTSASPTPSPIMAHAQPCSAFTMLVAAAEACATPNAGALSPVVDSASGVKVTAPTPLPAPQPEPVQSKRKRSTNKKESLEEGSLSTEPIAKRRSAKKGTMPKEPSNKKSTGKGSLTAAAIAEVDTKCPQSSGNAETSVGVKAISDNGSDVFSQNSCSSSESGTSSKVVKIWDGEYNILWDRIVEGREVPPVEQRVETNLFGKRVGRNEMLAVYFGLETGKFLGRKKISSHEQLMNEKKEKAAIAAGVPYVPPVTVDEICIPDRFVRLVCAAHYEASGKLLRTHEDIMTEPFPRIAVQLDARLNNEVWMFGDYLEVQRKEAAMRPKKPMRKAPSTDPRLTFKWTTAYPLAPAPAGTRLWNRERALAAYDAAIAAADASG